MTTTFLVICPRVLALSLHSTARNQMSSAIPIGKYDTIPRRICIMSFLCTLGSLPFSKSKILSSATHKTSKCTSAGQADSLSERLPLFLFLSKFKRVM